MKSSITNNQTHKSTPGLLKLLRFQVPGITLYVEA